MSIDDKFIRGVLCLLCAVYVLCAHVALARHDPSMEWLRIPRDLIGGVVLMLCVWRGTRP